MVPATTSGKSGRTARCPPAAARFRANAAGRDVDVFTHPRDYIVVACVPFRFLHPLLRSRLRPPIHTPYTPLTHPLQAGMVAQTSTVVILLRSSSTAPVAFLPTVAVLCTEVRVARARARLIAPAACDPRSRPRSRRRIHPPPACVSLVTPRPANIRCGCMLCCCVPALHTGAAGAALQNRDGDGAALVGARVQRAQAHGRAQAALRR